jgi:hypothetical protein
LQPASLESFAAGTVAACTSESNAPWTSKSRAPNVYMPVTKAAVAGSMWTDAPALPVSDIEVRNNRLAALSAGKVNLPYPVRGVTVSSAPAPLPRPTL